MLLLLVEKDNGGYYMKTAARARVEALLDANSFVEIGAAICARTTDYNMGVKETPSDGVITGYGTIHNKLVYVYSQDGTVLGGTVGEMHAKKIVQMYEMAMKMGAPIIACMDSQGMRLQEGMDALHGMGSIFKARIKAKHKIPQIAAVFGSCGGGQAVAVSYSDFAFMEEEKGKLFVNAPNTLDANQSTACDTSSAWYQATRTGIVDGIGDESTMIAEIRNLLSVLPSNCEDEVIQACRDDANRLCVGLEQYQSNIPALLAQLSDAGVVIETKKQYAEDVMTAFIIMNGMTVGVVATREKTLSALACMKASKFVDFCDGFRIPILTITNITKLEANMESEGMLAAAVGQLMESFVRASVPKVNLITEQAIGTSYIVMNSKAIDADFAFAWPDAKVGIMDSLIAAKIMYQDSSSAEIKEMAKQYEEEQVSAKAAARRGYVDQILEPSETRKYLIASFEMLYTKRI